EAQSGGNIALLQNDDIVVIDSDTQEIYMKVSDEELDKRRATLELPPLYTKGVLGKYAHNVTCSSSGAVTDYYKREEVERSEERRVGKDSRNQKTTDEEHKKER